MRHNWRISWNFSGDFPENCIFRRFYHDFSLKISWEWIYALPTHKKKLVQEPTHLEQSEQRAFVHGLQPFDVGAAFYTVNYGHQTTTYYLLDQHFHYSAHLDFEWYWCHWLMHSNSLVIGSMLMVNPYILKYSHNFEGSFGQFRWNACLRTYAICFWFSCNFHVDSQIRTNLCGDDDDVEFDYIDDAEDLVMVGG